ncbi:MAG: hypothetical protein ACMUIU_18375 [bacterium]
MKTRNCKLSLLVIFLALCFIIYAGNCYTQVSDFMGPSYNILDQLDIGYPYGIGYLSLLPFSYSWDWPFYLWRPQAGKTALELLLDTVPNLNITYESFYGVEYKPYRLDLEFDHNIFDYRILQDPMGSNLNVYQNPEIYALPLSQIHKLYYFTQDFPVQPIMPDIWVGYGAGMSLSY